MGKYTRELDQAPSIDGNSLTTVSEETTNKLFKTTVNDFTSSLERIVLTNNTGWTTSVDTGGVVNGLMTVTSTIDGAALKEGDNVRWAATGSASFVITKRLTQTTFTVEPADDTIMLAVFTYSSSYVTAVDDTETVVCTLSNSVAAMPNRVLIGDPYEGGRFVAIKSPVGGLLLGEDNSEAGIEIRGYGGVRTQYGDIHVAHGHLEVDEGHIYAPLGVMEAQRVVSITNVEASGIVSGGGDIYTSNGDIYATTGNIYATAGNISTNNGSITSGGGLISSGGGGITSGGGEISSQSGDITTLGGGITTVGGTIDTAGGPIVTADGFIGTGSGDITSSNGNIGTGGGDVYSSTGDIYASAGDIYTSSGSIRANTATTAADFYSSDATLSLAATATGEKATLSSAGIWSNPKTPYIRVDKNSPQILGASGRTIITFPYTFEDVHGEWNGSRYTPTTPGLYQVCTRLRYWSPTWTHPTRIGLFIEVNGAVVYENSPLVQNVSCDQMLSAEGTFRIGAAGYLEITGDSAGYTDVTVELYSSTLTIVKVDN